MVMLSMALLLVIFASLLYWAATNSRLTVRNNLFNESESAAESATENIMTYMMRDFNYGSLGSASSYNYFPTTNGWPIPFQWSDTNGNTANAASINIGAAQFTQLNSQYAGLYAFAIPVTIASTAKPLNQGANLSSTVYQTIQFARSGQGALSPFFLPCVLVVIFGTILWHISAMRRAGRAS